MLRLTLALLGLMLVVPAASALSVSLRSDLNTSCQVSDPDDWPTYDLAVNTNAGTLGQTITIDNGEAAYFVATDAHNVAGGLSYGTTQWAFPVPADTTTGSLLFDVIIGSVDPANCEFTAYSAPGVPVAGEAIIVSPGMSIPEGGFLAIKVTDLSDPLNPRPTVFPGSSTATITGTGVDPLGQTPAYPVPGPASILVMALGALAVVGRVWMVRRSNA